MIQKLFGAMVLKLRKSWGNKMISVCMATYNGEKYLKEQLDSILKQIKSSDELIISDDGSTDSTRIIIKEYQKEYKNIYLIDGPKMGVQKNFENALKTSQGDIIFLSDQDDIWMDDKVNEVLEAFQNPNVVLILHDAQIVDQNGQVIEDSFFEHRGSKSGLFENLWKNSYLGCCMALRRSVLECSLPFPPKIEMHDWWIGLIGEMMGEVRLIDKPLLKYRRHGENVSSFQHHPFKKMVMNRLYFIQQLVKVRKRCLQ